VGFGRRPAVVVVDVQRGFTDPQCPLGADVPETVQAVADVLDVARATSTPVFYTVCVSSPRSAGWQRKLPANATLAPGSAWIEVDPRVRPEHDEPVIHKHFASAFFETDLDERLKSSAIDTIIVTGLTTSGCIRATAVDGCSLGYRVVIPREAVADRIPLAHVVSLFDIDLKYGDVLDLDDVTAGLDGDAR
jgi:nicotinamidase-related amidase